MGLRRAHWRPRLHLDRRRREPSCRVARDEDGQRVPAIYAPILQRGVWRDVLLDPIGKAIQSWQDDGLCDNLVPQRLKKHRGWSLWAVVTARRLESGTYMNM